MILNKATPSVDLNYWIKSLYTAFFPPTNQYLMKLPIVLKPTNKITYFD